MSAVLDTSDEGRRLLVSYYYELMTERFNELKKIEEECRVLVENKVKKEVPV